MKKTLFYLAILTLAGCDRYTVTLNDQPVYKPAAIFADYNLPDLALNQCVSQTLTDQNITKAQQLHSLNCSSAGIGSLKGLERFSGLQQLNLSSNPLTEIGSLSLLADLTWVDLSQNLLLSCEQMAYFTAQTTSKVIIPSQCANNEESG